MTYRLTDSTRLVANATAGAGIVAIADVVDREGADPWALAAIIVLAIGVVIAFRLARIAVIVTEDEAIVRNVLSTTRVEADRVVGLVPLPHRSELVLSDGTTIPSLLRAADIAGGEHVDGTATSVA